MGTSPENIMIPKLVYCVEGLDRLGKSTLIQGIQDTLGYFQVIHFAKPQKLKIYEEAAKKPAYQGDGGIEEVPEKFRSAFLYQQASFRNSMLLARSGARIIFDRWHIGEAVYSQIYRGYSGDYVFTQERIIGLDRANIRLILLIENFRISNHFSDDGKSLGPVRNRTEEQDLFIDSYSKSIIHDKRIINVTASNGEFRPKEEILEEALA